MIVTNKYKRVPCSSIIVNREERQRTEIDTSDIDGSIAKLGVLKPILVHDTPEGLVLIAGERRLTSSMKLGLPDIPVRFLSDLTPDELQLVELEENVKRQQLTWQDEVKAQSRIHELYVRLNGEDWSMTDTAKELDISLSKLSRNLRVAAEIDTDPRVAKSEGPSAAYNIISRRAERAIADTMSDLMDIATGLVPIAATTAPPIAPAPGAATPLPAGAKPLSTAPRITVVPTAAPVASRTLPAEQSILLESFLDWAPQYTGPKFNLIHCDFPYGINFNAGAMSGRDKWNTYNDSPDVYWALITVLCENLDKIMAQSGHMVFWFSMEYYTETLDAFRRLAPDLNFQAFPLIWHKTDNVGILPDPKRGPRRVYETALIASRGDRPIVKAVSNAYGAPTDKSLHPSTKPEPMLRHFFQMFVDENTRILDPTCGSGAALRAAESLGAGTVLGLEIDPDHHAGACTALRQFRIKRAAEAKV